MGWEFDIQVRSLPEDDKSNTLTWVGAPRKPGTVKINTCETLVDG
jgi:hypothetical protein